MAAYLACFWLAACSTAAADFAMKFLIFLSAYIVAAFCYPTVKTWPLSELHETFSKLPEGDPLRPYLEEGAGLILGPIFEGKNVVFGHAIIPSPTGAKSWTRAQLSMKVNDTTASPVLRIMIKRAMENMKKRNTAIVAVPAVDISVWTSSDINKYIRDPKTKPALMPYLKKAQKEVKKTKKGKKKPKVTLVTPVNMVPTKKGTNHYPMGYVFQKIVLNNR